MPFCGTEVLLKSTVSIRRIFQLWNLVRISRIEKIHRKIVFLYFLLTVNNS